MCNIPRTLYGTITMRFFLKKITSIKFDYTLPPPEKLFTYPNIHKDNAEIHQELRVNDKNSGVLEAFVFLDNFYSWDTVDAMFKDITVNWYAVDTKSTHDYYGGNTSTSGYNILGFGHTLFGRFLDDKIYSKDGEVHTITIEQLDGTAAESITFASSKVS